jgi:hypothetical protein
MDWRFQIDAVEQRRILSRILQVLENQHGNHRCQGDAGVRREGEGKEDSTANSKPCVGRSIHRGGKRRLVGRGSVAGEGMRGLFGCAPPPASLASSPLRFKFLSSRPLTTGYPSTVKQLRPPINCLAAPKCLPTHGARSVYPPCVRAPTSQSHPYAQTKRRRGPSHTLRIDQVREYDSDGR